MSSSMFKNRTMSRSGNFKSTSSTTTNQRSQTLKNEAKNVLNSASMENIEVEYIKNLRQQVYYLELECNYLRQQLNLNGLQTTFKYDKQTQELKRDMLSMQIDKGNLEKSLVIENQEKQNIINLLQHTESNYGKEKELLLKEIALLRKQKLEVEENLIERTVELNRARENLEKHHMSATLTNTNLSKLEYQIDSMRKDNVVIRAELNDTRALLISRDNLIKDLHCQLQDQKRNTFTDLKSSLTNVSAKLSLTNDALTKEANTTQQLRDENERLIRSLEEARSLLDQTRKENSKLSISLEASLKQNESDLLLAKKNADLSKESLEKIEKELQVETLHNKNLVTQNEQLKLQEKLEQKSKNELKTRIRDLENALTSASSTHDLELQTLRDELKSKQQKYSQEQTQLAKDYTTMLSVKSSLEKKINELNDSIDQLSLNHNLQLEAKKSKIIQLQSEVDRHLENYQHEKITNNNLQQQVDNLLRQESIHTNLISSLKIKISEIEDELSRSKSNENSHYIQLNEYQQKIVSMETDNLELKSKIEELNLKMSEIDRLKRLEDLVNSQRWGELGSLAESMKSLSRNMGTTTITTTSSSTAYDETENLRNSFNLNLN